MSRTKIHGYDQIQDLTIKNLQIASDAAIELTKLEKSVITADGLTTYSGNQSMGGYTLTNLGTPILSGDATTKSYVDAIAQGLSIKDPVTAATEVDLGTISYNNGTSGVGSTITDTSGTPRSINTVLNQAGLTLTVGETLLVKDQTTQFQNGIYEVTTVGIDTTTAFVLTRISPYDEYSEIVDGSFFFVNEGDNANNGYVQTNTITTMGTDAISFSQFSGAGQVVAGDGIDKVGNTLSVDITDFVSTGLEDDGSNNIRLAAQGNGITGGAGNILSILADPTNQSITVISSGISVSTDGIDETHIDWGSGINQVDATSIPTGDTWAGTAINVDAALEELRGVSAPDVFSTFAVSGQDDIVADSTSDTITFIAGTDITITTNSGTDTITIASAGNSSLTASLGIQRVGDDFRSELDGSTLVVTASGVKLADLTDSYILVGNGSNIATGVAVSGDATISNTGVISLASDIVKNADIVTREVPSGLINNSNVTYTLANTPVVGTEEVYLNGILQNIGGGNDYTISGVTITMADAPHNNEILLVSYIK